jgi:hypothetical protein
MLASKMASPSRWKPINVFTSSDKKFGAAAKPSNDSMMDET